MEFQLSREEELIFREMQALSEDIKQLAENLVRHHKQRQDYAEAQRKKAEEEKGEKKLLAGMPMMGMNRPALKGDMQFILDRLNLLVSYIDGKYFPPYNPSAPLRKISREEL